MDPKWGPVLLPVPAGRRPALASPFAFSGIANENATTWKLHMGTRMKRAVWRNDLNYG
jgi:hypothetical protein